MNELTPSQIVAALDHHIVGQQDAKRAVAIAIRNRWRRQQLGSDIRNEVMPKNIILIGSTGVGKTEIARRVAQLVRAPFLKVEASKYTEVGYYGRDVESMVRELVDVALNLVKTEELEKVEPRAVAAAEDRVLDLLAGEAIPMETSTTDEDRERRQRTRETFRRRLRAGELDNREVEVQVDASSTPVMDVFSNAGVEQFGFDLSGLMQRMGQQQQRRKRLLVPDALRVLKSQEAEKLIDQDRAHQEAVRRAETGGIIFLDEIDKIISSSDYKGKGPEVSREGVQRDLLPIVEGSTVNTRYGMVRTDHVLFIGAGAFHGVRPSDMIPELQGRFPIRVELQSLTRDDYLRILREPRNALPRQYSELLATEGVRLEFAPEGLERMADLAWDVNQSQQNIGARRLYALCEKLLEEPLFLAPDAMSEAQKQVFVDRNYVDTRLGYLLANREQSSYIL
ncbi:MAG: ATP-dependent protease ATPase subunit HslU [Planctomycetota bacterium]